MERISFCSMNCRGLGDSKKRYDVFNFINQLNFDVYCLQDTHFTKSMEPRIRNEWEGDIIFNSYSSAARGVAVLFRKDFKYVLNDVFNDNDGNLLGLHLTVGDVNMLLINLYGPNSDTPEFFDKILEKLEENNSFNILCGDWNLVINPDFDYEHYLHINNAKARDKVLHIMNRLDLLDIWRCKNNLKKCFTWRKTNPNKQARLDFYLISDELSSYVKEVEISPGYRTDHSLVSLVLQFPTLKFGRGYWKFNNSLLKDALFIY